MTQDSKLSAKMKLIAKLCADPRLSSADLRGAVTLLAAFHNNKEGQCYPSYPQLAEASATSKSSAVRCSARLKALGYCSFEENSGGRNKRNQYDFSEALKGVANGPLIDEKGVSVTPFRQTETVSGTIKKGVSLTHKGCQPDTRSKPTNKPINKPRGAASPSPLEGAATAAPEKRDGLQTEVDETEERKANLAKLDATSARLKQMVVKTEPKPPPRMNGPTRHKASPAEIELYRLLGQGVDIDALIAKPPKPPPIELEAGRLDNVSHFPSAVREPEAVT